MAKRNKKCERANVDNASARSAVARTWNSIQSSHITLHIAEVKEKRKIRLIS